MFVYISVNCKTLASKANAGMLTRKTMHQICLIIVIWSYSYDHIHMISSDFPVNLSGTRFRNSSASVGFSGLRCGICVSGLYDRMTRRPRECLRISLWLKDPNCQVVRPDMNRGAQLLHRKCPRILSQKYVLCSNTRTHWVHSTVVHYPYSLSTLNRSTLLYPDLNWNALRTQTK